MMYYINVKFSVMLIPHHYWCAADLHPASVSPVLVHRTSSSARVYTHVHLGFPFSSKTESLHHSACAKDGQIV